MTATSIAAATTAGPRWLAPTLLAAIVASAACAERAESRSAARPASPRPITLTACQPAGSAMEMQCGTAIVPENRAQPGGRELQLTVVVVPARSPTPAADPIFFIAGGPGQTVTGLARAFERSPYREERAVVLLDQRGTSAAQPLDCGSGGAGGLQEYFEPLFGAEEFSKCRSQLESKADLTQYTTEAAVEDMEAVRMALGYQKINLLGVSYGTRVALTYMRRHPSRVRAAVLTGLAPPTLRNPLHHARGAQEALDSLLADCTASAPCRNAFPRLRAKVASVAERLRRRPERVAVTDPFRGDTGTIVFDAEDFGEALRTIMYTAESGRRLPLLIHQASTGEFGELVQASLIANRNLRDGLRRGMLLSVVCSEDIPRISEEDIAPATRGTLLGDARVRQQIAACAEWPRASVPKDHDRPFTVAVPTLLVSGSRDPVTPARWGEETLRYLPAARHIVIPGAHGVNNACVATMAGQLMRTGSVAGLDTGCVRFERYGDFVLP